jgi:nucleotide-binding universal stress UspA family protein
MATILCATDFSPAADRALLVAKKLAAVEHASLEVLHVLHVPPGTPPELIHKQMDSSHSEGAEAQLEQRKRSLADRVIDVASSLRTGFIDEAIVQRATELRADLVVVATHNRAAVARAFMGSVAERVIRTAKSPVLAVPPAGEIRIAEWNASDRPLHITAGIDLSRASDAALAWLKDLRRHVEYRLRLVHLYWPPREHERLGLDSPDPFEPDPEAVSILTRELQAHVAAHLGKIEFSLAVRPLWGTEDDALVWEAETDEADLLVVGTRQGRGGSTAIATVRSARLPVVCVPAPAATVARLRAPNPLESVLVTTDLSPLGNAAIPQAYRLLMRGRGTVTLLHVAEPAALWLSPDRRNEMETALLNLVPRGFDPHAIRTRTLVVNSDSPGEAIVQAARRIGPDVVVMSSHGRSGLGRAVRGSVTDQVLHAAPMPVLVVADPERSRP